MSSAGHEWTKQERDGWSVCSRCGMVRNYDRETTCSGALPKIRQRSEKYGAGLVLLDGGVVQANTDEWLLARRSFLGASDVPVLFGEGYADQTAARLLGQKLDDGVSDFTFLAGAASQTLVIVPDIADGNPALAERLLWGHLTEPVILREVGRRLGGDAWHAGTMHARGRLSCTVDGWYHDDREDDDGAIPVEIKNVGEFAAPQWKNGPPRRVELQVQAQLEVLDEPRAVVAALLGGNRLVIYVVERDRTVGAEIRAVVDAWWQRHVIDREPLADTAAADEREEGVLEYGAEIEELAQAVAEADRAHYEQSKLRDAARAALIERLKAGSVGVTGSGLRVSYVERTRAAEAKPRPASTWYELRVKHPPKGKKK